MSLILKKIIMQQGNLSIHMDAKPGERSVQSAQ